MVPTFTDDHGHTRYHAGYTDSWRDGVEAAYAALRLLHDEAMDEVHESRARRREPALITTLEATA